MKTKACKLCGSQYHSATFCWQKKNKRPSPQSTKEIEYRLWIEEVARPAVTDRDGNLCQCAGCNMLGYDLDHKINKGSHPELKMNINNLTLMCRWCHIRKTDRLPCNH